MNYRKHGLKALGLSFLALLGLMAFAAGGAQASGLVLVEGLSGHFTSGIQGTEDNPLVNQNRLLILGLNMEIFCHKATATGSLLETGSGSATIVFKECLAQGVEKETDNLVGAVCKLEDITAKADALVILHKGETLTLSQHGTGTGDPYILFTPEGGVTGTFATVINESVCALPEEAKVKGCVVAKVEKPNEDEVTKLISTKGMLTLFGCHLLYGAHEAHLDADANVSLTGIHAGLKWGVE